MDLEALPPEEPGARSASVGQPAGGHPALGAVGRAGPEQWASPPVTEPVRATPDGAATTTGGWATGGWSRSTRLTAGALGVVTVGVAGFAVGSIGSRASSVRLHPAAAVSPAPGATPTTSANTSPSGDPAPRGRRLGLHRPGTAGTVAEVNGTSFTVSRASQTSTKVTTNSSTAFAKTVTGTLSDAITGSRIAVRGTRSPDGSLAANQIQLLPAGTSSIPSRRGGATRNGAPSSAGPDSTAQLPPGIASRIRQAPFAIGMVSASSGGVITLTTPWGSEKITTSATTVLTKTVPGTLADVAKGEVVTVKGMAGVDGSVAATAVHLAPAGTVLGAPFGLGHRGPHRPGIGGGSPAPAP